jgi:hypothetical protein
MSLAAGVLLWAGAGGLAPLPAAAAPDEQAQPADNATCLRCHQTAALDMGLSSGERMALTVEPALFEQSAHAKANVRCIQCHPGRDDFPHPKITSPGTRQYELDYYRSCVSCHEAQFTKGLDGMHQRAFAAGDANAPVCTDCHDPHRERAIKERPRSQVAVTCSNCHNAIFNQYRDSVHGAALLNGSPDRSNPDVPTCTDCHGAHAVSDPNTVAFRLASPTQMCGTCHTDEQKMARYGLSTRVLDTYIADFHGTTVSLFQKQHPDQQTNKPVCFDCHGVHDIRAVDDPEKGLHVRQNMLTACKSCHPDATLNFPDSWLSHYVPSAEKTPAVYYVDLFYKIFIPTVLGGMGALVVLDVGRRMYDRFGGTR